MWNVPNQGSNPCPPRRKHRPPGKSQIPLFSTPLGSMAVPSKGLVLALNLSTPEIVHSDSSESGHSCLTVTLFSPLLCLISSHPWLPHPAWPPQPITAATPQPTVSLPLGLPTPACPHLIPSPPLPTGKPSSWEKAHIASTAALCARRLGPQPGLPHARVSGLPSAQRLPQTTLLSDSHPSALFSLCGILLSIPRGTRTPSNSSSSNCPSC